MLNRITMTGRLVADPELRRTQSGVSVTSFRIANDRDYSKGEEKETDFFDVVAWRSTAEFICKYFSKGRMISVDGRLQTRGWKDREGNNRVSTEILVDNAYFADSKKDDAGGDFPADDQFAGYGAYQGSVPGSGGNNKWRGNCSLEVVRAILRYVLDCKHYYGKQTQDFTLLDPMSGSGTSQAAAQSLGVRSLLYDLNPTPACGIGGWDALRDEVDDSADLIFLHPPYHNLIPYSGNMWGAPHKDDLSRCSSYPEFVDKLNYIVQKLFMALRRDGRLAVLVGDIRTKGSFYSMQHDLIRVGAMEAFIVKGQYNCVSDTRT